VAILNDTINAWPLVLVLEDSYYPDRAPLVLGAMRAATDELVDASAACDGYAAEIDAHLRQN
jgi:hypothetical protein